MRSTAIFVAAAVTAAPIVVAPVAQAGSTVELDVATFNICNVKCGSGQFAWDQRAPSVVRNIVSSRADVIAIQESDKGSDYWLAEQLRARGYDEAVPDTDTCATDGGCVPDSHVFYRRQTMDVAGVTVANRPLPERCEAFVDNQYPPSPFPAPVRPQWPGGEATNSEWDEYYRAREQYDAEFKTYRERDRAWREERADCPNYYGWTPRLSADAGSVSHASLVAPALGSAAQNRNMAWAALKHRASGSVVFVASVHLPNEKTPAAERLRKALASAIPAHVRARSGDVGLPGAPLVVMGDLNSYYQRQPRGAHWVLGKSGFRDAYSAKKRVNAEVPTVNVTGTLRNPFPDKPFRFDKPARLDYVFHDKGKALKYEVYLKLKGGRFDNRYRSSDHNLVRATLRLPSVTG